MFQVMETVGIYLFGVFLVCLIGYSAYLKAKSLTDAKEHASGMRTLVSKGK